MLLIFIFGEFEIFTSCACTCRCAEFMVWHLAQKPFWFHRCPGSYDLWAIHPVSLQINSTVLIAWNSCIPSWKIRACGDFRIVTLALFYPVIFEHQRISAMCFRSFRFLSLDGIRLHVRWAGLPMSLLALKTNRSCPKLKRVRNDCFVASAAYFKMWTTGSSFLLLLNMFFFVLVVTPFLLTLLRHGTSSTQV